MRNHIDGPQGASFKALFCDCVFTKQKYLGPILEALSLHAPARFRTLWGYESGCGIASWATGLHVDRMGRRHGSASARPLPRGARRGGVRGGRAPIWAGRVGRVSAAVGEPARRGRRVPGDVPRPGARGPAARSRRSAWALAASRGRDDGAQRDSRQSPPRAGLGTDGARGSRAHSRPGGMARPRRGARWRCRSATACRSCCVIFRD